MRSIKESIIGRKGTTSLSSILNIPSNPAKFNIDKAYKIIETLFHHDGAEIGNDPSGSGFKKVYKNPSKLIRTLGNWCAPKECSIFPITVPRQFFNESGDDLRAICVEYTFQGDKWGTHSKWDIDAMASAISDGLSIIPEFRNTIIFIFPHVRDGYAYKGPLYIANPSQSKKPILLNDIIGDDNVYKIVYDVIYEVF